MHIANISEAKAQLSALIEKVMAGEEVIIGKAGKPVARIIKYENNSQSRRRLENWKSQGIFIPLSKIRDLSCYQSSRIMRMRQVICQCTIATPLTE